MIRIFVDLLKNIVGIIKNLNLTKQQVLIILCLTALAGTAWSAQHYRKKSNRFEAALNLIKITTYIERDNAKLEKNDALRAAAKQTNKHLDKESQELQLVYTNLENDIAKIPNYIERLKDVKTVREIRKEYASIGYPIFDVISSDCAR